jgi:class 3 adenylate cyclase
VNSPGHPQSIDDLLDQAFRAIRRGDKAGANVLAERVLVLDYGNSEAEDLLAAPADHGEIRRLTIMFADLVNSTALSTQLEPEIYRTVVGRYRSEVVRIVNRYEGHLGSTKGDGLLAFFGHPTAHEDDARRAIQAGLDITRAVAKLSMQVQRRFGFEIDVRVGIHHGIVYLDIAEDDVYGFAANLAARMCALAEPGTVAVSDAIERLARGGFELQARLPKSVKGVDGPVRHYRVISEHEITRTPLGELVGRERESRFLADNWAKAKIGRLDKPGVVLCGDAGMGKSRLAWSAVDMAERSHAVVLPLIGSPFHTDVGLRPVRRLLERRCGIGRNSDPAESLRYLEREVAERLPDHANVVSLLAPVLGIPQSGYQPAQLEGRKLYDQIIAAVRDYMTACVRDAPSLILVEDMHWFDEDTLELVQSLVSADLGGHVFIVMTSRHRTALSDSKLTELIDLEPLTDEESDHLISTLHPEVTPKERKAVRRRCDGVPLYIEEIVAKVREQPTEEASPDGVPDTLYDALFARLRSSTAAVRVAEAAAIVGSRFDRNMLLSVVELDMDEIDDAIKQLVSGRVLEAVGEDSWRFRHELLREVAAELSPPSVRRRLHSRIADALKSAPTGGNPDWPLIAHHCEHASRFAEAATSYATASANAGQRGALGEARTYLSHAVAQVARSESCQDRDQLEISLRLQRAVLAQAAEGVSSPTAAADFERCLHLTGNDLGDDDLFATVMSLYPYYAMHADLDRVERLIASIRTSLTGSRQSFLPINECALGMLAWYRGDFQLARTKLDLAADTLTEEAALALDALLFIPNDPTAGLYTHRALARCIDGDLQGAEADLARAGEHCNHLTFPKGVFSSAYTRQIEVMIRIEAGQLDRAAAVAADLAQLGEQHGFDSWAIVGAAQRATAAALSALADQAGPAELQPHIELLTAFVAAWREHRVIALITFYDAILARLQIAAGLRDEAAKRLQIALDMSDQTGMHFYDAEILRLRSETTDDLAATKEDLVSSIRLARSQDARVFELRSALAHFDTFGEDGRQPLADAVQRFTDSSDWPDLSRARALLQ